MTSRRSLLLSAGLALLIVVPIAACAQDAPPTEGMARDGLPALIELPPALDRVLRDYEDAWERRDEAALAALFTEDGFVMSPGRPPAHGRTAIQAAYADSGGPLTLRAYAYSIEGTVGFIIGGYSGDPDRLETGKFVLALRLENDGVWRIAADMDNGN